MGTVAGETKPTKNTRRDILVMRRKTWVKAGKSANRGMKNFFKLGQYAEASRMYREDKSQPLNRSKKNEECFDCGKKGH